MSGVSVVGRSVVGAVGGSLCLRWCQSSRQWPRVSGEMASGGGIETVGVGLGASVGVRGVMTGISKWAGSWWISLIVSATSLVHSVSSAVSADAAADSVG